MAVGVITRRALGHHFLTAALLTDIAANNDGDWADVDGFFPLTVDLTGATNATVQVRVSNADTRPANTVHERQAGLDITADGMVTVDYPVRWLKTRVLNYVAGTINARLVGSRPAGGGRG